MKNGGSDNAQEQFGLLVVANRLPVDRHVAPDGTVTWATSPGGLVAALEPIMRGSQGAWIGWSGDAGEVTVPEKIEGLRLISVPLSRGDIDEFYEGMSNATLWPLYHDVIVNPRYHRPWWNRYVTVNGRFAVAAAKAAAPGATVWVQDYQLQLVPALLRRLRPDVRIGFFNHIPFPPYELFGQLPWRARVIEGLLGADLIGFQRPADANNFLRACRRLGFVTRRGTVQVPEGDSRRSVLAAAFPISVDAVALDGLARTPPILARAAQIRKDLGDPEVLLLGVDRLDYTKGILHRLEAVGELLDSGELNPLTTAFVQVATPSRERVEQYQRMRDAVEVTVGRINGDHSRLGNPVVHYLHQGYPRTELSALYQAADVLLVTALRDGMNLVAKEYVSSRHDEQGALILSEFAGSAIELPQAYLVNPHDIEGLKRTILSAVRADRFERARRMRALRRRVFSHDVHRWANSFLEVLARQSHSTVTLQHSIQLPTDVVDLSAAEAQLHAVAGTPRTTLVPPRGPDVGLPDGPLPSAMILPSGANAEAATDEQLDRALQVFSGPGAILIALDFDGVVAELVPLPAQAKPLPDVVLALSRLLPLPEVKIALISGRSLADLREVAHPDAGIRLVGSHGAEFDSGAGAILSEQQILLLQEVHSALASISASHPGSLIEVKPTAVALHTRQCERSVAQSAVSSVVQGPGEWDGTRIGMGKEVIEIFVAQADKGTALEALRGEYGPVRVLFAGDDLTDEYALARLDPEKGDVPIKVGDGDSVAAYRVGGPVEVAGILHRIADLRPSH